MGSPGVPLSRVAHQEVTWHPIHTIKHPTSCSGFCLQGNHLSQGDCKSVRLATEVRHLCTQEILTALSPEALQGERLALGIRGDTQENFLGLRVWHLCSPHPKVSDRVRRLSFGCLGHSPSGRQGFTLEASGAPWGSVTKP